jgi:acetyl-CoA carboxylase biotin carboxyl carrier protein
LEIDLKQIRELLTVVSGTDISELTIEFGDQRITVKKSGSVSSTMHVQTAAVETAHAPAAVHHAAPAQPAHPAPAQAPISFEPKPEPPKAQAAPEPATPAIAAGVVPITSPMVGTFYRSPSPTAAPFVNVGDHVAVGQTVCIIEAMKLMNDMPSEVSGKIVKVCVDSGTTVEYGQQLFLVDPKG